MTSFLSLSDKLQQHIKQVKTSDSRLLYYEKHFRIIAYISKSTIFSINEIAIQMHKDKIVIAYYTIAKFCNYLVFDNLLNKLETETKFKTTISLYFHNSVSAREIVQKRDYYKPLTSKLQQE